MYARGLSVRDIEAAFRDARGASVLSRTAVSQVTERLWQEYEAFAGRDLSEFAIAYFFVDGVAERLHAGLPREAVLCASGHHRGRPEGLAAPRAGHQAPGIKEDRASCTAFFEDLKRSRACYEAASPALAALLRDDFVQAYGRDLPAVVQCFVDDFEASIAHLRFPLGHRISHPFVERPVRKLMYGR